MIACERREKIKYILNNTPVPVSASKLAKECNVSRQIIVGDIALIRASGLEVQATPRGYILNIQPQNDFYEGCIACLHTNDMLEDELYTILDFGGKIIDVTVTHAVYGEISANLQLNSRFDADLFLKKLQKTEARPLSALTDGVHLHKIRCASKEIFDRICSELKRKGILFNDEE
ncbi:MAG TPA: transcription repressor NadR [Candidatus Butyricicoccus avistercoris]|uniref:Transcription repressor NadR n=1 Tax=Candidatus Butyricicoccus avistercoris TaxID=2838518 RepID=A0A9D1TIB3_9FIRM|nr:transcription repressor NadR [Candidatus Butyricicoccus avistercoris]